MFGLNRNDYLRPHHLHSVLLASPRSQPLHWLRVYSDSQQTSALSCATVKSRFFVKYPRNYVIDSTLIHDICSSSSSSSSSSRQLELLIR